MPFKSKAQVAKFASLVKEGKMPKATFDKWQAETGSKKLPKRLKQKPVKNKDYNPLDDGYIRKRFSR